MKKLQFLWAFADSHLQEDLKRYFVHVYCTFLSVGLLVCPLNDFDPKAAEVRKMTGKFDELNITRWSRISTFELDNQHSKEQ